MPDILKVNTVTDYHEWMGFAPRNPLVSIVDYSGLPPKIPTRKLYGFYAIFLKEQKCGEIRYGRQDYDYQEGTILFVSPGQVYGPINIDYPISGNGYALLFQPDIMRVNHYEKSLRNYTFFKYTSNEALHVNAEERECLMECLNRIKYELEHTSDEYSNILIADSIKSFLDYCSRFYDRQFKTRKHANHSILARLEDTVDKFIHDNKSNRRKLLTVQECADMLNISSNYLSDLMRKETGHTVLSYIHTKIIEQSKSELAMNNMTIAEIAYSLGFEYAHHFTRLFKKIEGCTPTEYRRKLFHK